MLGKKLTSSDIHTKESIELIWWLKMAGVFGNHLPLFFHFSQKKLKKKNQFLFSYCQTTFSLFSRKKIKSYFTFISYQLRLTGKNLV
jgi:hypothetical protein